MWFMPFIKAFRPHQSTSKMRARRARLLVELLELREMPAVFIPGNLIILQAGDNGSTGTTTGALFLNEITIAGGPVQQATIPNNQVVGGAGNQPITIDLNAAPGNGQLTRSYDGSVLSFAGLDAGINSPADASHNSAVATDSADRVVAVAGNDPAAAGFLDTTTHGQFYVGDDARGAVLEGPAGPIYAVGHPNQAGGAVSQGVHYFPTEGASIGTQVSASTNIRGATIGFDNRAYFATATIALPVNAGGIFTEAQGLPTAATPAADIEVVPSIFSKSKLGGVYLADMNGDGIVNNGDRLYFLDDGTVGGTGSGGLYVSTWNDSTSANPWNTPNNAASVAAGLSNHWSTPVRLGDAPTQTGSGGVGQLRGLAGTVMSPTEADLYTTAFDNVAGDASYIQRWADMNSGVSISNAQVLSGATVQITAISPLSFADGSVVQINGVGASTGVGALNTGYNGSWTIHVTGPNTFTYTDTNTGAGGLLPVNNQGAADVTIAPTTILSQANGTITNPIGTYAAIGLRGVAFAPVAATSITLDVNGGSSATVSPGTNVTFHAQLTNGEVGNGGLQGSTVAFLDQNTNTVIGTTTVNGAGLAAFTTSVPLEGNHVVEAYFAGGGPKALASARSGSVNIAEAGAAITVTSATANLAAAAIGRAVTLTAAVNTGSGPVATGTVSFYTGSVTLGNLLGSSLLNSAGSATLTTTFAAVGSQTVIAVYNGNNTNKKSQGTTSVNIAANALASVSSSANNVALNSTPTYTATINGNSALGTPAGTVTFHLMSATNNGTAGAASVVASSAALTLTAAMNNSATATWTGPVLSAAGSYFITVSYSPTPAATTPYLGFATDTLGTTNGIAFIETVRQAFTPGNLIAVQRGDGNTNLGSNSYLVFLDEYTPAGALVQSIALPNADSGNTHALFTSGQSPAEGLLNRSANGYYLTLAGYDTPVGRTFVTSTFAYQYPRTIALVDGSAAVDTSTAIGVSGGTGIAATIVGATEAGPTVTITTSAAHNFIVGQNILISGITSAGFNGAVTITAVTSMTFTFTAASGLTSPAVLGAAPLAIPGSVPYNPEDVVTNDGKEFWLLSSLNTGNVSQSGIQYIANLGASTALDIGPAGEDGHAIAIAGGQLYVSHGDALHPVGAALPRAAGQALGALPHFQAAYDAAFPFPHQATTFLLLNTNDGTANNPNLVYIADQANGLLKFWKDGSGNWQYGQLGSGTFGQKLVFSGGATGVIGYVNNPGTARATVQLYSTGSNVQGQNANQIASFLDKNGALAGSGGTGVDNGFSAGSFVTTALVGATGAPASPNGNENFAGLAFAPGYVTTTTLSDTGAIGANTFTATVTTASNNVPTGVVVFSVDGAVVGTGTLDGNGVASFLDSNFPAGSHLITASYQGDVKDGTSMATARTGVFSKFVITPLQGSALTAGGSFIVTVQAADQLGNPVSTYTGPTTIPIAVVPADPLAAMPATVSLNQSGFGFFLATLKTTGGYTITASNAVNSVSGSSPALTVTPASAVYFTVATPATALTNTSFPITVTALDAFHNVATNYTGTMNLSSSDDAADLAGDLGGNYTFTSGAGKDNGVHAFNNVHLLSNGTHIITAADTTATVPAIVGTSHAIATSGLAVTALTKTPTGFLATLNQPINPAVLTIYGIGNTQHDVLLVGKNSNNGQPYPGTLIVDATKKMITFNVSSNYLAASNPGGSAALPDDTYTVTLLSGVGNNGFQDVIGQGIDDGHGGHADFVGTFITTYQHTEVLGIPDFARGPNASGDTTTQVKVSNDSANGGHVGIPITIYNSVNLTSAGFTLTYNANILTVTGGVSDPSNAAATFMMTSNVINSDGVHSVATFTFIRATPTSGTQILGDITAYVPSSARTQYQAKDLLALGNITVNSGAAVVPGNAVDVNAYFGDVNGDHHLDGLDKGLIANVASTLNTGFTAFTLLDPAIIGDLSGDNAVTSNSTSLMSNYLLALPVAKIPALPNPPIADNLFTSPFAADPVLSLPATVTATSSGVVNVPVLLDEPHPKGSTGLVEAELTLKYDSSVLSASAADISFGTIPGQGTGWQLSAVVNAAAGQITIQLYSETPIASDQAGSLVNIAFHVKSDMTLAQATTVQLVTSRTVLADSQAAMILSPGLDWTAVLTSDWVQTISPACASLLHPHSANPAAPNAAVKWTPKFGPGEV